MAETTGIAWTDSTFNPWLGCHKVSTGCQNCYAERLVHGRMGYAGLWGPSADRVRTSPAYWRKPFAWNREAVVARARRRVFVGSLCDVFEDRRDLDEAREDLWGLIRSTRALDWLLLTKRPEKIADLLPADWGHGFPNVWLGTTVEAPELAGRIDTLAEIPAAVRFLSVEPMLGPVRLEAGAAIDWVIVGGESGPGFRGWDLEWVRALRADCQANGTAFFFKQSPGHRMGLGETLDGETVHELPTPRLWAAA